MMSLKAMECTVLPLPFSIVQLLFAYLYSNVLWLTSRIISSVNRKKSNKFTVQWLFHKKCLFDAPGNFNPVLSLEIYWPKQKSLKNWPITALCDSNVGMFVQTYLAACSQKEVRTAPQSHFSMSCHSLRPQSVPWLVPECERWSAGCHTTLGWTLQREQVSRHASNK